MFPFLKSQSHLKYVSLTLLWRRSLSHRNQSIDLIHDINLRHSVQRGPSPPRPPLQTDPPFLMTPPPRRFFKKVPTPGKIAWISKIFSKLVVEPICTTEKDYNLFWIRDSYFLREKLFYNIFTYFTIVSLKFLWVTITVSNGKFLYIYKELMHQQTNFQSVSPFLENVF